MADTGLGSFMAGIMKGMGKSRIQKREDARQDAVDKRQMSKDKIDLQNAKNKQDMMKMLMPYLQNLQGDQAQTTLPAIPETKPFTPTIFGDSFPEGTTGLAQPEQPPIEQEPIDIPGQIAQSQMNPMAAAMIKAMSGVDVPGALSLQESRKKTGISRESLEERIRGAGVREDISERTLEETIKSNERKFNFEKLKFEFTKSKPVWKTRTVDGVEWEYPYTQTGEPFPLAPIRKGGKKAMSAETAGKFQMAKTGVTALNAVRSGLFTKSKAGKEVLNKKTFRDFTLRTPWSVGRTLRQNMDDALETKLRIESGAAVPDQEVVRMNKRLLPSVFDNEAGIKNKLNRLKSFLDGTVETLDPNKIYGNNVEMFTDESGQKFVVVPKNGQAGKVELPDTAKSQLQEGQNTTFGNGQVWTLQNGQPVKVE